MPKELQHGSNIIKRNGTAIFVFDFLPGDTLIIRQRFIPNGKDRIIACLAAFEQKKG
jgi:hypothetical protein